jgi:hypothetical protein
MDSSTSLDQLKNVHLPDAVSIFPLANGWYILIGLILIIMAALIGLKFLKRKNYKKQVYAILADIEKNLPEETISEVSILIKRVAIMKFPEEPVHTMFGTKWLEFLDKTGKTTNFTHGDGHHLQNIYQNIKLENPEKFFAVIKQWLGTVL